MTTKTIQMPQTDIPPVHPIVETYRTWVDTLAGYMKRAADLLENLYAQQDVTVDELRRLCAKTHSLRHSDFDIIFGKVLAARRATRDSLASLVEGFRAGRYAVVEEIRATFSSDVAQAAEAWPGLKERLLGNPDDGAGKIIAALREVHVEQEKISTALSGLLSRGEKLKIDELKTVANRLAGRDSRESAELAALLGICESAGRNAGLQWQRLAG